MSPWVPDRNTFIHYAVRRQSLQGIPKCRSLPECRYFDTESSYSRLSHERQGWRSPRSTAASDVYHVDLDVDEPISLPIASSILPSRSTKSPMRRSKSVRFSKRVQYDNRDEDTCSSDLNDTKTYKTTGCIPRRDKDNNSDYGSRRHSLVSFLSGASDEFNPLIVRSPSMELFDSTPISCVGYDGQPAVKSLRSDSDLFYAGLALPKMVSHCSDHSGRSVFSGPSPSSSRFNSQRIATDCDDDASCWHPSCMERSDDDHYNSRASLFAKTESCWSTPRSERRRRFSIFDEFYARKVGEADESAFSVSPREPYYAPEYSARPLMAGMPGPMMVRPSDDVSATSKITWKSRKPTRSRQSETGESTEERCESDAPAAKPATTREVVVRPPTWSIGSELHDSRECKPCLFYHTERSCQEGPKCSFCHYCEHGEVLLRRKKKTQEIRLIEKRSRRREERKTRRERMRVAKAHLNRDGSDGSTIEGTDSTKEGDERRRRRDRRGNPRPEAWPQAQTQHMDYGLRFFPKP